MAIVDDAELDDLLEALLVNNQAKGTLNPLNYNNLYIFKEFVPISSEEGSRREGEGEGGEAGDRRRHWRSHHCRH